MVSGGTISAERLGQNYYGEFIEAAKKGGMAAVCETEFFKERIQQNPSNRDRLMAMDPKHFIEVMENWWQFFKKGASQPVIGASEEALRGISVPTVIVPGNDDVHPRRVG